MRIVCALVLLTLMMSANCKNLEMNGQFVVDFSLGLYRIVEGIVYDLTHYYPDMELDAYKSDAEVYQSLGYRFEIHKITTPDGYILSAWRVPGKLSEPMSSINNKPPVMLQHGLLDNSATWTVNYFNQSLVYLLLEDGYDVWLTNTRGNFNSYEHTNPKEYSVFDTHSEYWNFTLDDMARYDMPSNIDYILDYTNNKKLTYIGHSQGTVQFFAGNCITDVASKIDKFVGVGPVMYANHATSPAVILGYHSHIANLFEWLDANNVLLWPKIVGVELNKIANHFRLTIWRVIQFICGVSETINIDLKRVPVIGRREPGGSGLQNMMHWLQYYQTGEFKMMDYGQAENMKIYGQPTPPLYDTDAMENNLENLEMFLVKGGNDALVQDADFKHLLTHFEDKIGKSLEYIEVPDYGHLDYIWAKDSKEKVAEPIIEFLRKK